MKTKLLKIVAATALVTSTGAQAFVIDLFSWPADADRQQVVDVENGGSYSSNDWQYNERGSHPSILGGYRDLMVNAHSGAKNAEGSGSTPVFGDAGSILKVEDNRLQFDNTNGVESSAEVQWDGMDAGADKTAFNKTGLRVDGKGVDFVNQEGCPVGGCDRMNFEVFTADQGFIFTVGIYTDENTFTEFDLISSGIIGTSTLLFSDFQLAFLCGGSDVANGILAMRCGAGGAVVDFTNVGAMRIAFTSQGTDSIAIDLSIGAITKTGVPEPGVLALLGIGLAAGALARRRRLQ